MKSALAVGLLMASASLAALASDVPPPEAFRVLPPAASEGPAITDYLRYQTEMAWRQDDQRRKSGKAFEPSKTCDGFSSNSASTCFKCWEDCQPRRRRSTPI